MDDALTNEIICANEQSKIVTNNTPIAENFCQKSVKNNR